MVPCFRFALPEWKDVIISGLNADPSSSFNTSVILIELGATSRTAKKIRHVHRMETWRRSAKQQLLPYEILQTESAKHQALRSDKNQGVSQRNGCVNNICASPKRRWSGATMQDLDGSIQMARLERHRQ
jgi:hypothetical protein